MEMNTSDNLEDKPMSDEISEEITPVTEISKEVNIFIDFHNKYLQLKTLTSYAKEENCANDVKVFIESMIEELNNSISTVNTEHKYFARFLGMKIFLHYILVKFMNDSEAIATLEKAYTEVKPYLNLPEVSYSGFLIMNSLSTLQLKFDSLEKVKEILEECQNTYNSPKPLSDEDTHSYFTGEDLFSSDQKITSNNEAKLKFEKLVLTNLLFLGSIYEKLGEHFKDIFCYHTAFSRMLEKGLISPFKWVDFTTRLACVFIDDNNFKDARHHLAAATHVQDILEVKYSSTTDTVRKEILRNNSIHLSLAWVRYCVLLFEKSKNEDRKKFAVLFRDQFLCRSNPSTDLVKTNTFHNFDDNINLCNNNKIEFKKSQFIEALDKNVDVEESDSEECDGIIKENSMNFGDFINEIGHYHPKEKDHVQKKEELNVDITKYEVTESVVKSTTELKEKSFSDDQSSLINVSEDGSNNQFIHDEINEDCIGIYPEECGDSNTTTQSKQNEKINEGVPENEEISKGKFSNELIFESLGYLPVEHTVTKELIQNPEEARALFAFAYKWSKKSQSFYSKTRDFFSYVQVNLNMVSLYRLCAFFQGYDNLQYRISLEQTRESILEQLVTELSEIQPESHVHVRLYQEMALLNIDLAMLNMCNIYNIQTDDNYKLCALDEIQTHINHTFVIGDILQQTTKINEEQKNKGSETIIHEEVLSTV